MLRFALSHQYRGIGESEGLERGLLVYEDNELLVEEGMGFGAVALQTGGFTYFASLAETRHEHDGIADGTNSYGTTAASGQRTADEPLPVGEWTAIYRFDRRLVWKILGRPSISFTRLLEAFVTYGYMRFESAQSRLLAFSTRLVRLFRIEADFQSAGPRGHATVHYRTGPYQVDIVVSAQWQDRKARLFVMNELGGNLFSEGLADGQSVRPPTGWQRFHRQNALYSPGSGLAFTFEERAVPSNIQSTLFWGREVTEQYCWAGFESDLRCLGQSISGYGYQIRFQRDAERPALCMDQAMDAGRGSCMGRRIRSDRLEGGQ